MSYNVPITRRDPGPDGVLGNGDDANTSRCTTTRPRTEAPRSRGGNASTPTTPIAIDSMEFTLTKRASDRWMGQVSYFAVKNHRWLDGTSTRARTTSSSRWTTRGRGPATSAGPIASRATSRCRASFRAKRASKGSARTSSGRRIRTAARNRANNGNTTIRLEPYGSRSLSAFNILNFRVNKDFRLGGSRRLGIDFDVFNLLNSATPTGADFASGPTFGYATGVTPPLITRIGARLTF